MSVSSSDEPPEDSVFSSNEPLEDVFRVARSKLNNMIARSDPDTSSMCLENIRTDPTQRAHQFEAFVNHVTGRLERIFDDRIPVIDPWIPNTTDKVVLDHYIALQIPSLHGKPCLLLHELGEDQGTPLNRHKSAGLEAWPDREERIQSIFLGPKHAMLHSIFLNTSGSGKTRLVLEGLCSEWGFYFTCKRRTDEIGSSDIVTVMSKQGCMAMQGLMVDLQTLPENITILHDCPEANNLSKELRHNVEIATRCFHAVMIARLLVFSCFLMTARRRENFSNQPLHFRKSRLQALRKAWLFCQLDIRLLGDNNGGDLLRELTCILCTIEDYQQLSQIGCRLLKACNRAVLELDPGALLYCVIDEAQAAVEAWPKAFRDYETGCLNRPALRAMINPWLETYKLNTIVTGTSINRKLIMDALCSTMGKEADINDGVTSTGSWADHQTIKSFLTRYLPESYLATPSGVELIERARYWLWGRPRFISAYVQLVVQNGFKSYHRLLSLCVQAISNFLPLDAEYWENQEPIITSDVPRLCPFDYERVSNIKHILMDSVQSMTYERLMSGNLDFTATLKLTNYELVECGFARFPGSKIEDGNPLFDEPLAYLAADIWLNSQKELWIERHDYFVEQIGKHSPVANGLERYTALVLAEVFRDFTQLSRVFDFIDIGVDRDLAKKRARLVSCWYDSSNTFRVAPSRYPIKTKFHESSGRLKLGPSSPSHFLGYKAPKGNVEYQEYEGNLRWLEGRNKAPFLFPMQQFGPDLMFRLQLEHTGEIITVALQVKHRATSLDFSATTEIKEAIRTVTPQYFWKDRKGHANGPDNLSERTNNALAQFPSRFNPNERNYHSVLRGLFVFPAQSNTTTCEKITEVAVKLSRDSTPDGLQDPHDICVIPVRHLLELEGPIQRGLTFLMMKAKQQSEKRDYHYPDTTGLKKADIIPQLKLYNLEQMYSDELGYQLLLHRQLEANRQRGSGPVRFLTPHPKYLTKKERLLEVKNALERHIENEEHLRVRRRHQDISFARPY